MFRKLKHTIYFLFSLIIFIILYRSDLRKYQNIYDFLEVLAFTLLSISLILLKPGEKIAEKLKTLLHTYKKCKIIIAAILLIVIASFFFIIVNMLDVNTFIYNSFLVIFSILLSIIVSISEKIDELFSNDNS